MNFLKKKLKPLTSGLTNINQSTGSGQGKRAGHRDLEDDLYDEYVVEAPPHPSELLALGVEPTEIDVNDPDKLRELYKKAIEEGKDKQQNSVLLARQRQKEELEEKKRTKEEWKFFESLTTRVEQVVKSSQKNLDNWKASSAVDQLAEPDYELRQTADEVFKPVNTSKIEKSADNWIDFGDDNDDDDAEKKAKKREAAAQIGDAKQAVGEAGCPATSERKESLLGKSSEFVVNELLEDFGIDLRTEKQKRALEEQRKLEEAERAAVASKQRREQEAAGQHQQAGAAGGAEIKVAPRPRPRPRPAGAQGANSEESSQQQQQPAAPPPSKASAIREPEVDPFDTSFVAPVVAGATTQGDDEFLLVDQQPAIGGPTTTTSDAKAAPSGATFVDPFDTSHVNF